MTWRNLTSGCILFWTTFVSYSRRIYVAIPTSSARQLWSIFILSRICFRMNVFLLALQSRSSLFFTPTLYDPGVGLLWDISLYRIYLCENAHRDMHMYMQKSKKHNIYMHKSNPLIRNVRTTQTLELKRSVCVCVSSEQEQEKRGLFARKIAHVYATLTGRLCASDKQHYLFVRIGFVCAQKPDNFHLGHNWEDLRHLLRGVNLFQFKHSEFGVECHEIVARSNIWKKCLSKVLDCLWIKLNT